LPEALTAACDDSKYATLKEGMLAMSSGARDDLTHPGVVAAVVRAMGLTPDARKWFPQGRKAPPIRGG